MPQPSANLSYQQTPLKAGNLSVEQMYSGEDFQIVALFHSLPHVAAVCGICYKCVSDNQETLCVFLRSGGGSSVKTVVPLHLRHFNNVK